jgi:hypothetical protein
MNARRCVLVACIAFATHAAAASEAPAWTALPSGLETRTVDRGEGADPRWVLLVRADLARVEVRVIAPASPATADAAAGAVHALLAINGGFFDAQQRPIGWLVADSRALSAPNEKGWAALVVRGGRASITSIARRGDAPVESAVQAGPRLVSAGRPNDELKPQSARRSFVGLDGSGHVVVGTTGPFPAGARELAAWLARPESDGGAGLADALNLDGGSSTQLFVAGGAPGGKDLFLPGVPVPDFVVLVPRAP